MNKHTFEPGPLGFCRVCGEQEDTSRSPLVVTHGNHTCNCIYGGCVPGNAHQHGCPLFVPAVKPKPVRRTSHQSHDDMLTEWSQMNDFERFGAEL